MPLELFHAMDVRGEQSVVGRDGGRQTAGAVLSGWPQRPGLPRRIVPVTAACRLRPRWRRSSASGTLGRPAKARATFRQTYYCDCIQRVFEIWATSSAPRLFRWMLRVLRTSPRWWELSRHRWSELFESHRLDFMVAQFHSLIGTLERITGSTFDLERLRALMEGVNQQEQYFEEVREMICRAPKAPVRMHEQVSNVMAAQWLRGSDWALRTLARFAMK